MCVHVSALIMCSMYVVCHVLVVALQTVSLCGLCWCPPLASATLGESSCGINASTCRGASKDYIQGLVWLI